MVFIEVEAIKKVTNLDKPCCVTVPTSEGKIWVTVKNCKNKVEAIDYAMLHYGADKHGNINIIRTR